MGILNYVAGRNETIVQVILSDFLPGVEYRYELLGPDRCVLPNGTFWTDPLGNATLHLKVGASPAFGECPADDNGDWSDADIQISLVSDGLVHALGENPTP